MLTTDMVSMLRCPTSPRDELRAEINRWEGKKIIEGKLICDKLNLSYPIQVGVPDLIPYEKLTNYEWRMWKDHLDGFQARREQRIKESNRVINKLGSKSKPQKAFAQFTGITKGTILDIGCGPGKFRFHFDSEAVKYCGIDPIVLPEVEDFPFVRALAEYIPFEDNTFTDVVVISAMDHFRNLDIFFKEVVRVLKPEGKFHILQSIHEIKGPITAAKLLTHKIKDALEDRETKVKNPEAPKHLAEFSKSSLFETVTHYFNIVATDEYSYSWYSPRKMFLTLSPKNEQLVHDKTTDNVKNAKIQSL